MIRVLGEETDGFVVIGGYAVNALGQHRFSVDLDLATDQKYLPVLETILRREGYSRHKRAGARILRRAITREYTKPFGNYRASVELYVNNLVCRQTGGT